MKLSKTKNSKVNKKVLITVLVAVLILGIGGTVSAYYLLNQNNTETITSDVDRIEEYNRNDVDLEPSSDEQQKAGSDIKKGALDSEGTQQPDASFSLSFTAISQTESTLQIRTLIDTLIADGTCELSLTKGSTVVNKTSATQSLASNSTCQGFDIPLTELSKGTWTVKVKVTNDRASGEANRLIDIK